MNINALMCFKRIVKLFFIEEHFNINSITIDRKARE